MIVSVLVQAATMTACAAVGGLLQQRHAHGVELSSEFEQKSLSACP